MIVFWMCACVFTVALAWASFRSQTLGDAIFWFALTLGFYGGFTWVMWRWVL
jgi:hypothetical protein